MGSSARGSVDWSISFKNRGHNKEEGSAVENLCKASGPTFTGHSIIGSSIGLDVRYVQVRQPVTCEIGAQIFPCAHEGEFSNSICTVFGVPPDIVP